MQQPLAGRTVAVPETRLLDVLSRLLEARGARVLACPLVAIHDPEDFGDVDRWLGAVCEDGLDDLVLLTGEGLRRLLRRAEALRLRNSFRDALAACRTVTRGPKPAAALREIGLKPVLAATTPTSQGVIECLRGESLQGRSVGVQYYGTEPVDELAAFLAAQAGEVLPVFPYRYADEAEDRRVDALIDALVAGEVDAITFTSSPQVRRLYAVARRGEREAALDAALAACCVVAVGPVVADTLRARGVAVTVSPEGSFFIKPMISALVAHWGNGSC